MNKLVNFCLEIQGEGIDHTSKISCSVMYHSATVNTDLIDRQENILEQVFQLVVKEFSKKQVYGEFEIKSIPVNLTMETLEKEILNSPILSLCEIDNDNITFEIHDAKDWCYPHIISDAMKHFFVFHIMELTEIERAQKIIPFDGEATQKLYQEFRTSLREVFAEHEGLIDDFSKLSIETIGKRQTFSEEMKEKVAELEHQFNLA